MPRILVSSKVRPHAQLVLVLALLAACSDDRNRGGARIIGQCQDGASQACACIDGRTGAQVCMNDSFSACDCSANTNDASGVNDGAQPFDVGFWDGGEGFDGPVPDFGFSDSGVDSGVPFDTGVHDNGFPPFDSGFPDSGFPDSGFRPDASPPGDSGFPFPTDGGSGGDAGPIPCIDDTQCGVPLSICENSLCVDSCFFGAGCGPGLTCSFLTGRCGSGPGGICITDDMCAPPLSVCEIPLCVEGCTIAGCTGGLSCNNVTGHCQ